MARPEESCPADSEISGFLLGELPVAQMDRLARHFDICASCESRSEQLEDVADDVVGALRISATSNGAGAEPWLIQPDVDTDRNKGRLAVGARLGDYEILEVIGEGGMGHVFKARHVLMNRVVAVKTIRPEIAWSGDISSRFQREMQAAAQLSHPNVVSALDAGVHNSTPYLVMEFIDGRTLSQCVAQDGPFDVARAVELIRQAAEGLESVHQNGLIHRDVKPSNLLLTQKGVLKVSDVGLARFDGPEKSESDSGEHQTSTSVVMGSAGYMSPEQARSSRDVDQRTDMYSLGCTLYFLLSGMPPFTGECTLDVLIAHREQNPPSLSQVPDLPAQIRDAWLCAMSKDPADRFDSMADFRANLARSADSALPLNRKPRTAAFLLVVALLIAVAGSMALMTPKSPLASDALYSYELTERPTTGAAGIDQTGDSKSVAETGSVEAGDDSSASEAAASSMVPLDLASSGLPALLPREFDAETALKSQEEWSRVTGLPTRLHASPIDMELALIPPGLLPMPSPSAQVSARVRRPFYLGVNEVTVGQFMPFIKEIYPEREAEFATDDPNLPVTGVTVTLIGRYHRWLSDNTGRFFRLPGHVEWMWAARAGNSGRYFFQAEGGKAAQAEADKRLADYAWYAENSGRQRHPTGQKLPNPWGLFDVYGNALEISRSGANSWMRGGSFASTLPVFRNPYTYAPVGPDQIFPMLGFRSACEITDEELSVSESPDEQ